MLFRSGNPNVETLVRELLYVRPLQALVVLDRMRAEMLHRVGLSDLLRPAVANARN